MKIKTPSILIVASLVVGLAACGSGGGLTTSSIGGGSSGAGAGQIPPPKPITASDRAVHTGATIARAQRCGFYFNPDEVRANYIASETQAGTPPDAVQKATTELDKTRQALIATIAKEEGYCTEGRNREVKASLTRQLAGDFSPPQARQTVNVGWFDHQKREATMDGQKVFDAAQKKIGPRDE